MGEGGERKRKRGGKGRKGRVCLSKVHGKNPALLLYLTHFFLSGKKERRKGKEEKEKKGEGKGE